MPAICFYFQAHQPFRIKNSSFFDLGNMPAFINDHSNKYYLRQVLFNAYSPSIKLMRELVRTYDAEFKFSFSLTGTLIEQLIDFYPGTYKRFRQFIRESTIEMISETYYHSLAFFYSNPEFLLQVIKQKKLIAGQFGKKTTVFRNAELAYRSDMAQILPDLGFSATIIEGTQRILNGRSPNYVYADATNRNFSLLVRNPYFSEKFSRFKSPRSANCRKIADDLVQEITALPDDIIVIGFDIENLGEHHHKFSGIFNFLKSFIRLALKSGKIAFVHPSEAVEHIRPAGSLEIYTPVTWHGRNRNLSAWNGNIFQKEALKYLYSIEKNILQTKNDSLISAWRKLQSTDHLLYMTTEESINSKDVAYFSPFNSIHESYLAFMNAAVSLDIYAAKLLKKTDRAISSSLQ